MYPMCLHLYLCKVTLRIVNLHAVTDFCCTKAVYQVSHQGKFRNIILNSSVVVIF